MISIQTELAGLYSIFSLIPVKTRLHHYSAVVSVNVLLPPAEEWHGRQQCFVPLHQLLGDYRILGCGLPGGGEVMKEMGRMDSREEAIRKREQNSNDREDGEGYSAFSFAPLERKV